MTGDAAAVAFDDRPHDRQPDAGTADVTRTSLVEPGEAIEDALAVTFRDAGAVVLDDEVDGPVVARQRDLDAFAGVTIRVIEEVADDAGELLPTSPYSPGRHSLGPYRMPAHVRRFLEHDVLEVDERSPGEAFAIVLDARQLEQVADDTVHALVLVQDLLRDVRPVDAIAIAERDLEGGSDGRHGAAELVRRVGDELPLARGRALETLEHLVHRAGEQGDLVV
jgi:hypothetical protein